VPRWAVIGIFILLLIGGMAYARAFLMPVVMAFLLSMVFSPVRRTLERAGLPTGIGAFLIVGVLLVGIVTGIGALATPVSGWIERAPMIGLELEWKLRSLRGATEGVRDVAEQVDKLTEGEQDPTVQRVVVEEGSNVAVMALTLPAVASQVAFTLVLLFFLLASGEMFYEKIVNVMPTFRDKRTAIRIARDIEAKLSHYLFTITAINAGLGPRRRSDHVEPRHAEPGALRGDGLLPELCALPRRHPRRGDLDRGRDPDLPDARPGLRGRRGSISC
jgi:predicted PurR-regulated permease PerM